MTSSVNRIHTFSSRIENLTGSVARHILSRSQNQNLISFAGGLPSPDYWKDLKLPTVSSSAYQYGPSEGENDLRSLVSQRLRKLGLASTNSNTVITTGSQQGLDLVSKLFIDQDSPIAIEAPTYLAALQCFHFYQAQIHSLSISEYGINLEELERTLHEKRPRFIYLNPTYQNPSGLCYELKHRQAIAAILDRYNAVLVEDDPYRDISYEKPAPPPISSFLKKAPWIYLSSASKILLPGLRIGYLSCSPCLYSYLLKLKQASDLHTSRITQSIAFQLLSNSETMQQRLRTGIEQYRSKRDCLQTALERNFTDYAKWDTPSGGMFFWLKLAKPVDLDASLEKALKSGVAFMPGDSFFDCPNSKGQYVRLNFTSPSAGDIERGIPILRNALI